MLAFFNTFQQVNPLKLKIPGLLKDSGLTKFMLDGENIDTFSSVIFHLLAF